MAKYNSSKAKATETKATETKTAEANSAKTKTPATKTSDTKSQPESSTARKLRQSGLANASFLQEKSTVQNIAIIFVLLVAVMGSAFMVVHQVFKYRYDYRGYTKLMQEKDNLNAEWGRLLIEQQTFGATAQIGSRAVTQLRMFSPPASQTVVIASNDLERDKIALGAETGATTQQQVVQQQVAQ